MELLSSSITVANAYATITKAVVLITCVLLVFCVAPNKCIDTNRLHFDAFFPSIVDGCSVIPSSSSSPAALHCHNVTLHSVNVDYLANPAHHFNELQLNAVPVRTPQDGLSIHHTNGAGTEVLIWTNSQLQTAHLDTLLLPVERRFDQLRRLDISHNDVDQLHPQLLWRLVALEQLSVAHNRIGQLSLETLANSLGLIELDLSDNQLTSIVANGISLFRQQSKLQRLNIAQNHIDDLPRGIAFQGLGQLVSLNASHNRLSVVPFQTFRELGNIESIDLSHNSLVLFSDNFFTPNKKLRILRLQHNRIEKLMKHTFYGLKELHHLDLSHNELISIDRNAFDSLIGLRHLNLSANQFTSIASTVFAGGLHGLHRLDLSGNIFKELPSGFLSGQLELQEFWLDGTRLERLGNWVSRVNTTVIRDILQRLRFVVIRNNEHLIEIDSVTFQCTPSLEHLILSGNRLVSLPKELGELQSLRILDVSGNRLTSVPWQIGNLIQLKQFHMLQNDFSCDCRMYWLVGWLEEMEARQSENDTAPVVGNEWWRNGTTADSDLLNMHLGELKCRNGYPGDMIHVLRQLHCNKPVILHSSESRMHVLRSDAVLECSFSGNPAPDIIWVTPTNQILRYYADPDAKPVLIDHTGVVLTGGDGGSSSSGGNNAALRGNGRGGSGVQSAGFGGSGGGVSEDNNNNNNHHSGSLTNGGKVKRIEFQMLIGNNLNFTAASKALGISLLDNGSLKVHNISRKDSGVYTCYGYNIMGNATADIRYVFINNFLQII